MDNFKTAIRSGTDYCHINLFWIDSQLIAMAGVPIREQAINQNIDNLFGEGDIVFPSQLEVAAQ
eukprot:9674769-Lingulodinium_polyedra.AAC.1